MKQRSILTITTCLSLMYYSININSWKFSFVGDDWPFYVYAIKVMQKNFLMNPFSFKGVFLQNSILSSMYQAVFITLLGDAHFVWVLSNLVLIIPISIFFYLWVKRLFDAKLALYSTIILQCSFYIANFFKIGKNMPQALALFIVCLFLATATAQNPSKRNFLLLGLFLGISFYIYIGPIFPLLVWPCLLPLIWGKLKKQTIINSLFLIGTYLLLLVPLLFELKTLHDPATKTFPMHEYTNNWQMLINVARNFALFYWNFDYLYNQFVAGPYLDILSRGLAFIGTIFTVSKYKKQPYTIILLTYICTCVVIGIFSPYSYTPTTRGLFFLPFGALFAGIGLQYVITRVWRVSAWIFLGIIFLSNLYLSQIGVFQATRRKTEIVNIGHEQGHLDWYIWIQL